MDLLVSWSHPRISWDGRPHSQTLFNLLYQNPNPINPSSLWVIIASSNKFECVSINSQLLNMWLNDPQRCIQMPRGNLPYFLLYSNTFLNKLINKNTLNTQLYLLSELSLSHFMSASNAYSTKHWTTHRHTLNWYPSNFGARPPPPCFSQFNSHFN